MISLFLWIVFLAYRVIYSLQRMRLRRRLYRNWPVCVLIYGFLHLSTFSFYAKLLNKPLKNYNQGCCPVFDQGRLYVISLVDNPVYSRIFWHVITVNWVIWLNLLHFYQDPFILAEILFILAKTLLFWPKPFYFGQNPSFLTI